MREGRIEYPTISICVAVDTVGAVGMAIGLVVSTGTHYERAG